MEVNRHTHPLLYADTQMHACLHVHTHYTLSSLSLFVQCITFFLFVVLYTFQTWILNCFRCYLCALMTKKEWRSVLILRIASGRYRFRRTKGKFPLSVFVSSISLNTFCFWSILAAKLCISHVCLAGWSTSVLHGKNFIIGQYMHSFQPVSFVYFTHFQASLMSEVLYHFQWPWP